MPLSAAENPFRITRIHGLPYQEPGLHLNLLMDRFEAMGREGGIVGSHGNGKTTLLRALGDGLAQEGLRPRYLHVRDGFERPGRAAFRRTVRRLGPGDVLLLDGAEQLPWLTWRAVLRQVRRRAGGILITTHKPGRLPTLHTCATSPATLAELVGQLLPGASDAVLAEARQLHAMHGGDIREVFLALYDQCAAGRHGPLRG